MRLELTPRQQTLRRELAAYFDTLLTPQRREALTFVDGQYRDGQAYLDIIRRLGSDGWLSMGWPKEYGGQGRSMVDQLIFGDAAAVAGVAIPYLTINTIGPTIMEHGTAAQKEFFLPRIAAGTLHFSVGYSEVDAGTDLAALTTRAVPDGAGGWIFNGHKMWTSQAKYADYVWLAARTDTSLPRHRGLSVFAVPTNVPGFSYTTVRTVAGVSTAATYYDDIRLPGDALIGELNGGWPLITNQLNHERVALFSSAMLVKHIREVTEWADRDSRIRWCGGHRSARCRRIAGQGACKHRAVDTVELEIGLGRHRLDTGRRFGDEGLRLRERSGGLPDAHGSRRPVGDAGPGVARRGGRRQPGALPPEQSDLHVRWRHQRDPA